VGLKNDGVHSKAAEKRFFCRVSLVFCAPPCHSRDRTFKSPSPRYRIYYNVVCVCASKRRGALGHGCGAAAGEGKVSLYARGPSAVPTRPLIRLADFKG